MNFSEYANKWLPKIRKNYKTRLEIAAWEISVAASNADIILTNNIVKNNPKSLTEHAQAVINLMS